MGWVDGWARGGLIASVYICIYIYIYIYIYYIYISLENNFTSKKNYVVSKIAGKLCFF